MILESPVDARVQQLIEQTGAARATLRPMDFRSLDPNAKVLGGHYRTQVLTGNTTVLNAADSVLSLRWANEVKRFVLLSLKGQAYLVTAFGAVQEVALDAIKVSGFSAADTGGTPHALGANCRMSAEMAPSAAEIRSASATAITPGTRTLEGRAFNYSTFTIGNTATNVSSNEEIYRAPAPGLGHPLELLNLEGLLVRIGVTQGAAGVVRFKFDLEWAELPV